MKRFVRSAMGAFTALIISVGPVWAQGDCAPYISGWFMGGPSSGYLVGEKKVTAEMSFDWILSGGWTEEFCVGTYQMLTRDGGRQRIQVRCDTYTLWGLF